MYDNKDSDMNRINAASSRINWLCVMCALSIPRRHQQKYGELEGKRERTEQDQRRGKRSNQDRITGFTHDRIDNGHRCSTHQRAKRPHGDIRDLHAPLPHQLLPCVELKPNEGRTLCER